MRVAQIRGDRVVRGWGWFQCFYNRLKSWQICLVNSGHQSSVQILVKWHFLIFITSWYKLRFLHDCLCKSHFFVLVSVGSVGNWKLALILPFLIVIIFPRARWILFDTFCVYKDLSRDCISRSFFKLASFSWQVFAPISVELVMRTRHPRFLLHMCLSKTQTFFLVSSTKCYLFK